MEIEAHVNKVWFKSLRGRLAAATLAVPLFAVLGMAGPAQAQNLVEHTASGEVEAALGGIFKAIEDNKLEDAYNRVNALLAARPNYRLAYLIKGDLLLARGAAIRGMGAMPGAPADQVSDLRAEALQRLRAYRDKPPVDTIPRYLLQMRPDQKHAVVVDTKKSRLYLYANDNGRPRFVADFYMTHGKNGIDKAREGDQKTPIGVYYVTSYLPKAKLADIYGVGAFPINYPNDWDKRNGRNGHGIWLHGVPADTFARAPLASDGCVALSNADLEMMGKSIDPGLTPVIISDSVEFLSLDDWNTERQSLLKAIEDWRRDWESRDTDAYLTHYAHDFEGDGMSLREWAARKRQVNAGKTWIKVKLGNMDMFRYPGVKKEMVVVTFQQDYQSSNLSNAMKKRLYWIKEGSTWKIVDEGSG
ncbi:MAG TPA: L,D-transpeptidase family protein [Burkholderiales bacterium]|nr:L,D-transpeptidase family protein [Burkholderiales bacterium]